MSNAQLDALGEGVDDEALQVVVALRTDSLVQLQHVVVELKNDIVLVQLKDADPAVLFWDVYRLQVDLNHT